jgi:hypothetical protein
VTSTKINIPGEHPVRKLLGILPISLVLLSACGGGGGGSSSGGGGGGTTPQACTGTTVTNAQQVQNPVMLFPTNYNNGVIIELPPVPPAGLAGASGVVVFGIGTVANNMLAGAVQLKGNPSSGAISATLNGVTDPVSFLDSGSNGNFFTDSSITVCSNKQFYCPAATVNESAMLQGSDGTMAAADFSVANADTLFNTNKNFTAFNNLGGPNPTANSVDLGLPFFYGRNIFTGFAGSGGNPPPYFAYGSTQTIAAAGPPNVETLTVDAGPAALGAIATNTPFVTISICVPGTSTCQNVDHIEVDTGSVGLRLISSVLTSVKLPLTTNNGQPYGECIQFADGTSWGSLAKADIKLPVSGATAAGVNVQLIGDPSVGSPPASCTGTPENTVPTFGANGILGVGPFSTDCSDGSCGPGNQAANYYSCPVTQ